MFIFTQILAETALFEAAKWCSDIGFIVSIYENGAGIYTFSE